MRLTKAGDPGCRQGGGGPDSGSVPITGPSIMPLAAMMQPRGQGLWGTLQPAAAGPAASLAFGTHETKPGADPPAVGSTIMFGNVPPVSSQVWEVCGLEACYLAKPHTPSHLHAHQAVSTQTKQFFSSAPRNFLFSNTPSQAKPRQASVQTLSHTARLF